MGGGGSYFFWLGASADADQALVSDQAAPRLAPSGFDPWRWEIIEVGDDGRAVFRHAHSERCDCVICSEFDAGFEAGFAEGTSDAAARIQRALA